MRPLQPPLAMIRRSRKSWHWSLGFTARPCARWNELSLSDESNGNAVHLEESARRPNVNGSDEPGLQFHQPDESITGETVIADSRVATPEQIMASDELLRLIASALRDLGSGPREAFILHAVEGFSVEEIVAITGQSRRSKCSLLFALRATTCARRRDWPSSSRAGSFQPAPPKSKINQILGRLPMKHDSRTNPKLAEFQDQKHLALSVFIFNRPLHAIKLTKKTQFS